MAWSAHLTYVVVDGGSATIGVLLVVPCPLPADDQSVTTKQGSAAVIHGQLRFVPCPPTSRTSPSGAARQCFPSSPAV